jgi:hypothetical protein
MELEWQATTRQPEMKEAAQQGGLLIVKAAAA